MLFISIDQYPSIFLKFKLIAGQWRRRACPRWAICIPKRENAAGPALKTAGSLSVGVGEIFCEAYRFRRPIIRIARRDRLRVARKAAASINPAQKPNM